MDSLKLDEETLAILSKISRIFEQLKYRYSVIGATAFLIHQIDLIRITRDIDFCILINGGWDAFDEMKHLLAEEGFHSTKIPHRMKTEGGFIIDLLPVSSSIVHDDSINWPDGVIMNANGLKEAVERSVMVNMGQFTAAVASLPGLVLLKLFAYDDQKERKHIHDIFRCFIFYESERRFDLLADDIEGLTYENAGALLMGRDLKEIISEKQTDMVRRIILEIETKFFLEDDEMELLYFFKQGLG
ncbi:MAG: hypothetical protein ACM3SY_00350 [Candidatus Omnitrophota bacterium]